MPTFASHGVRLRPMRPADAAAVFRLYGDRAALRFGFAPPMASMEDAHALLAEIAEKARTLELFHFGVATLDTDEVIGHATLFHWHVPQRRAEVGYSVRSDLWNRGLGTAILSALVALAFDELGLRRLEADVDPRNLGSVRVLEKVGFVREGLLRARWDVDGELQDGLFFGLLASERASRDP